MWHGRRKSLTFRFHEIATPNKLARNDKFSCCARKKMRLTAGCFDKLNMTIWRITNIPCHSERIEESRGNETSLYLRHFTSFRSREIATPNKSARNDDKVLFHGRGDATRKEQGDGITEKGEFVRQSKCQMQPQRKERSSDAMSCVFESRKKLQEKKHLKGAFSWQGRRDSNTQPTVLETVALPLSHSPMHLMLVYYTNSI